MKKDKEIIPFFNSIGEVVRGGVCQHLITLNGQYCYEIVFKQLLEKIKQNTKYCIDSRPIFYMMKIFGADCKLNQGSEMLEEIVSAAKLVDKVYVIGGSSKPKQLSVIGKGKVVFLQGKISNPKDIAKDRRLINHVDEKLLFLICMGCPKQDAIASIMHGRYSQRNLVITIGLGGSLEMWSGNFRRAPLYFRIICLEGIWRYFAEPSWMRIMRLYFSLLGLLCLPLAIRRIGEKS